MYGLRNYPSICFPIKDEYTPEQKWILQTLSLTLPPEEVRGIQFQCHKDTQLKY